MDLRFRNENKRNRSRLPFKRFTDVLHKTSATLQLQGYRINSMHSVKSTYRSSDWTKQLRLQLDMQSDWILFDVTYDTYCVSSGMYFLKSNRFGPETIPFCIRSYIKIAIEDLQEPSTMGECSFSNWYRRIIYLFQLC